MGELAKIVAQVNTDLRTQAYLPSIGHGFLGIQKGHGVTRFVPILSDIDMAVYYHICFELSESILIKRPTIFGGWHSVPKSQKAGETLFSDSEESAASSSLQDYFSDPFSSVLWLKEWREFTALIGELCKQTNIGNFVVQTDVANFYDSIEIPRLVRRLRHAAPKFDEYIEALEVFLGYWNRRIVGYQASSKGIPQEIISDASRVIAHFYLQKFDGNFLEYCASNGLTYVRWADDILIFGSSKKKLEVAIHTASKMLLSDGLNLSAAKTRIFSRLDFAKYRGVEVLDAITKNDEKLFRRRLRSALQYRKSNEIRIDTIFRATIGFVRRLGAKAHSYEKSFLTEEARDNRDLLLSLNARQLANIILIADDSREFFRFCLDKAISVPFSSSKATFLHMLRRHSVELIKAGILQADLSKAVEKIESASTDSEIITGICIPATKKV